MARRAVVVSAGVAAVVFLVLLTAVLTGSAWLDSADDTVLEPLYRYGRAHPGWVQGWNVFCTVFGPFTFRVLGGVWIVVALIRRQWRTASFLFFTVQMSGLLITAMKVITDRPRPVTKLVHEGSTSFPSGHALGVLVGVLAFTVVGLPLLRRAWRPAVIACAAALVLAIGIGRVVLNVHHLSDVLAGWALGYLWVLVWMPVLTARAAGTPAAPGSGP